MKTGKIISIPLFLIGGFGTVAGISGLQSVAKDKAEHRVDALTQSERATEDFKQVAYTTASIAIVIGAFLLWNKK